MATIGGRFVNDSGVTEIEGALVTDQPLNADTIGGVAINNTPTGAGETLQTSDASNAAWTTAGGAQAVGCVLNASAIDVAAEGFYNPLWNALLDNEQDSNPLTQIPAGLGLDFDFDGTSNTILTTEAGVWGFVFIVATFAGFGAIDATWDAVASDGRAGIQAFAPSKQPTITISSTLNLPINAVLSPNVHTITAATALTLPLYPAFVMVRLA